MRKVLFDVMLPTTRKHYDFWVPCGVAMQTATMLIAEAMQNIEPDFYLASEHSALLALPTGEMQDPNATVEEIGFANGAAFVLV